MKTKKPKKHKPPRTVYIVLEYLYKTPRPVVIGCWSTKDKCMASVNDYLEMNGYFSKNKRTEYENEWLSFYGRVWVEEFFVD
jgi:hypothetical protein